MELKELIHVIKNDEELIIRYREKNQKVYYLGQRLFDIDLKNNKVTLPETLKLSGKEYKEKNYQKYIKAIKKLNQYNPYFEIICETATIEFTNAHLSNFKKKLESLENIVKKEELSQSLQELESFKIAFKDINTIESVIDIQQELFKVTVDKLPLKKPSFDIKFLLKFEQLESVTLNEIIMQMKELIKKYNLEFVGNKDEKMFQQYMMKKDCSAVIQQNAFPLEVEVVIYPYRGLKGHQVFVYEDKTFQETTLWNDTKFSGRIDNAYVGENKKIIFVEIKVDDNVISIEKNGVLKHLHDMRLFFENKVALAETLNELEEGYKIKTGDLSGLDKTTFKYYILCGYTSEEKKENCIHLIKEDIVKYKEQVIKPYQKIAHLIETKLLFVKIIKDEQGNIAQIEVPEKYDYTEILEIN